MSLRTTFRTLFFTLTAGLTLASAAAYAISDDNKEAKSAIEYYIPSENVMQDVDATLASAKASGKLALLILGADWCHDSTGLAKRMQNPELKAVIDQNYETSFIDVEFFDHGQDVVERFGQATIFATPTVMIIDPESGNLINGHNMHQWKDADALSLEHTLGYFTLMSKTKYQSQPIEAGDNPSLGKLLSEISDFEATQAARIKNGFQQMVPYLEMEKDKRPKKFYDLWFELRGLRYTVTGDMAALRNEAVDRAAKGETDISLKFPKYKAFSWE